MKLSKLFIAAVAAALWSGTAVAAVSAEAAKQLGTTLTEFGAEKAGNADGSIPAYDGGIKTIPADFKRDSGRYPDPFKDEKPLFTIDASNMAKYADNLSDGVKTLLQRFPDYHLNVYPTHRTMPYPDWVLKNTVKNATSAKLVGDVDGDGIEGAYGGIPFPIPSKGTEVMWNQTLRWSGTQTNMRFGIFFIDSSGHATLVGDQESRFIYPYYDPKASSLSGLGFEVGYTTYFNPPANAGQLFLQVYSLNHSVKDDTTWIYTPGQRRTRVAPELKYDTPAASIGGALLFDELGGFVGRMDRFDFKLVGKKEMFIPYNSYTAVISQNLIGPKHVNPDVERWEKHRVWVVEATLKAGKRHVYKRREYYMDEDSWAMSLSDNYDASGNLYRAGIFLTYPIYDKPRLAPPTQAYYDLTKGDYVVSVANGDPKMYTKPMDDVLPNMSQYTVDAMGGSGIR